MRWISAANNHFEGALLATAVATHNEELSASRTDFGGSLPSESGLQFRDEPTGLVQESYEKKKKLDIYFTATVRRR
jgi:hypothetical protein